jgi:SAM-dependent methyltransferase
MDNQRWIHKHSDYSKQDWITKPSIFAEQIIEYLPSKGHVLELGAGHGQDGIYFAEQGFTVLSTDLEPASLKKNSEGISGFSAAQLDLNQPFPFKNESFDAVYAHLALHYFDEQTTKRIFDDIYRVLKPNGILAFLVNSTSDPEYGTGNKLQDGFFETDGTKKRFFTVEDANKFASHFTPLLTDNSGETYKDIAKGVHNLIRFVGKKESA